MFQDHDGRVRIGELVLDRDEFLEYEPAYSLPAGMIFRRYEPGKRHVLSDGRNQKAGPKSCLPNNRSCLT